MPEQLPSFATHGPVRVYASLAELEKRLGEPLEGATRERGTALLHDASTMIRAIAGGEWPERVPEIIPTICLNMAVRAFHNPEGVRQQTIGDLSMTFGSVETGVTVTQEERRLIRIAAGFGVEVDSVQLTSGYEATHTRFVEVEGGGDWLPWQAVG